MTATVLPVLADDGRIAAVRSLGLLDTAPEERFDRITALTARLLDAPVVLLSLVDGTRQWVKSSAGSGPREVPVEESLCAVAVQQDAPLLVEDLAASPRFRHLAVVRDGRRWYAVLPLHDSTGRAVAT